MSKEKELTNEEFMAQENPLADVYDDEQEDQEETEEDEEEESSGEQDQAEDQEDDKPDNSAMARLRIEAAQARKEAEEAKRMAQEMKAMMEGAKKAAEPQKTVEDPEPDADDVEEHLRWQIRQQNKQTAELLKWRDEMSQKLAKDDEFKQAMIEKQKTYEWLGNLEAEFAKKNPDLEDAMKHMAVKMGEGVKALYPFANDAQINRAVAEQIERMTSVYQQYQLNPVEEFYNLAKTQYGYNKAPKQGADLKSMEKIRKASATGLNSGGSARGVKVTSETSRSLTNAQFAALPPDVQEELMGYR